MQHFHSLRFADGGLPAHSDGPTVSMQLAITNAVGSGAGAAVVTAVTLPAGTFVGTSYTAFVQPNQDAVAFISGKTNSGFNVTLNPRLAANTVAAGTFDVLVIG